MTAKEMIEERCKKEGLTITGWSMTDDGESANLGRWAVTSNEDEDYCLYEGDEGELSACVVGAEQYHNRRVCFSFIAEGMDEGNEVHSLSMLDPVS